MSHHSDPIDDLARIDPIDGEHLAAAWSSSNAKQALLQEITTMSVDTRAPTIEPNRIAGPTPRRPPRRVLRLAAGVAIAAFALVAVQGVFSEGSRAFAVRQLPNGVIEIDATTQFRDGEALAADLREFGIDVRITTVPSSPSMVGEVEVFAPGGGEYIADGLTFGPDGTPEVFDLEIDPNLFTEQLTIQMHVAARDGERYVLANDVFGPGEVLSGLHCALGEPLRAEALAPYLSELGLSPVWLAVSPTDDPSITNEEQVQGVPNGQVLSGYAQDAATVEFRVQLDGVTLPDIYAADLADLPCTPEQAAAWD
jgi:hypothetical protein